MGEKEKQSRNRFFKKLSEFSSKENPLVFIFLTSTKMDQLI